jgi:histidinol-phosphatase
MDRALLEFATELVEEASGIAASRFAEGSPASGTADGSEGTPVDVEVEQLMRKRIGARFPDDPISGEHSGPRAGTSRRWVVEPMNGTGLFTSRVPTFSVLLAIEDEHGSAAGVVGYPLSDEVLFAGRGLGCWHQVAGRPPRQVTVNDNTQLGGAIVEMLNPLAWTEELLVTLHREVYLLPWTKGDLDLVTGRSDALVMAGCPMAYEDLAALPVLVGEAGGRVTDLSGRDVLHGDGSVLASNGHLHDELLRLLAGIRHSRDFRALREARAR